MCDTMLHISEDTFLLESERPPIEMIRSHLYGDECCRIEPCEDGPPRLKKTCVPWRTTSPQFVENMELVTRLNPTLVVRTG